MSYKSQDSSIGLFSPLPPFFAHVSHTHRVYSTNSVINDDYKQMCVSVRTKHGCLLSRPVCNYRVLYFNKSHHPGVDRLSVSVFLASRCCRDGGYIHVGLRVFCCYHTMRAQRLPKGIFMEDVLAEQRRAKATKYNDAGKQNCSPLLCWKTEQIATPAHGSISHTGTAAPAGPGSCAVHACVHVCACSACVRVCASTSKRWGNSLATVARLRLLKYAAGLRRLRSNRCLRHLASPVHWPCVPGAPRTQTTSTGTEHRQGTCVYYMYHTVRDYIRRAMSVLPQACVLVIGALHSVRDYIRRAMSVLPQARVLVIGVKCCLKHAYS